MASSYDAVVVGAGPAGCAAALTMAKMGMSVALLERGQTPGSKNVFGGTVYAQPTAHVFPAFWEEAPVERPIISEEIWFLEPESALRVGFCSLSFGRPPYNQFTVFRPKFDTWLAEQAQVAGADLYTSCLVRDLILEKNGSIRARNSDAARQVEGSRRRGKLLPFGPKPETVRGVVLEDGTEIRSNMVVIAEGLNGPLAVKAGLRGKLEPTAASLYAKETLELPAGKIEDRFNLEPGQGALVAAISYPTAGTIGKGVVFTYKDALSILVGAYLDQMVGRKLNPYNLLLRFKSHPFVKKLIDGAKPVEYSAKLMPKCDYARLPKLHGNGVLLAGDAAMMMVGRHGTDVALLTGKYAGEAAALARFKGDYSEKTLLDYDIKVRSAFFGQDLKTERGSVPFADKKPHMDAIISKTANDVAFQYFSVRMETQDQKWERVKQVLKSEQCPFRSVMDLYRALQHWGIS